MEIDTETEFDLDAEDFNLDQIINSAVDWASSPSVLHNRIESPDITSNESTPSLELKLYLNTSSTPTWAEEQPCQSS